MPLAIVYSRSSSGMRAPLITVEAHLSPGLPKFHIVGLPEAAVKESKHRVRCALMNSKFEFPSRVITINLGPADLPKEGGRFDLPIAIGILAASKQIPATLLEEYEFTGELALSGALRPIRGSLTIALNAERQLIVPQQNAHEVSLVKKDKVFSAKHLLEVCSHLKGEQLLPACMPDQSQTVSSNTLNFLEVKGQDHAKRALEIAAAGNHSLLLIGPPGTGKTMLASRLPSILPELTEAQAIEVASMASMSSKGFTAQQFRQIPFRAPHHTSSHIALVGGGRPPRPGEISLAHHGVLFLDELPEFNRQALESLREPLESGQVTISRAAVQSVFPAQFQFIAAMNPCPCGYAGSTIELCYCSQEQIKRYMSKISGPLLDRIDMQVTVARIPPTLLANFKTDHHYASECIRERVISARQCQWHRQQKLNFAVTARDIERFKLLTPPAQYLLDQAMEKFFLSPRSYYRIIKLALTIADLEAASEIQEKHVSEALQYRYLDRSKLLV